MNEVPQIHFNDGYSIPQIGQGVALIEDAVQNVRDGIQAGYRAVDTATIYGNEEGVGIAIRESGEDIFVTTKAWGNSHGRSAIRRAFDESFTRLGLDHIGLYLIHWPVPELDLYVESWKALIELRDEGRVRSIGVSNFEIAHLERIIDATGVVPVTNQIELHPAFPQRALAEFHRQHDIVTSCWSPLGMGQMLSDPVIIELASAHQRSPAQIILRWHVEQGFVVVPKSASFDRLKANLDVFDFSLDPSDVDRLASVAREDGRVGPHPLHWTTAEMDDVVRSVGRPELAINA